jgi:hypothetical protein
MPPARLRFRPLASVSRLFERPAAPTPYLAPPPQVILPAARPAPEPQTEPQTEPQAAAKAEPVEMRWVRAPRAPLTLASHRLAIALGRAGQPVTVLARRFPHVLNAISKSWDDPFEVIVLLDEMLIDRRGERRGFPADALAQILALRSRCSKRVIALRRTAAQPAHGTPPTST